VKTSAGLVIYRRNGDKLEVLIGHIGGPWLAKKDNNAWSIIKGEYTDEDPKAAARREFKEETNFEPPEGEWIELGEIKQKSGKKVIAWAAEGNYDETKAKSNTVKVEWPPKSGQFTEYWETDRVQWFDINKVEPKLVSGQYELIQNLAQKLDHKLTPDGQVPAQQSLL